MSSAEQRGQFARAPSLPFAPPGPLAGAEPSRMSPFPGSQADAHGEGAMPPLAGLGVYSSKNRRTRQSDTVVLQQILASLKDAVLLVGPEGTVEFLNPAAAQTLHLPFCPPHQLAAYRIDFFQLDLSRALLHLVQRAMQTGQGQETVQKSLGSGRLNSAIPYHVTAMPLYSGQELQGTVLTLRDISAEQAREQKKAEFYNQIAHDLRTPLSVVLGFAELLSEELESANQQHPFLRSFLEPMVESGEDALDMLNRYLNYARIDAELVRLHRVPTALRPLAEKVVREMAPLAAHKRQRLILQPNDGDEANPHLELDGEKIRRALTNLVSNAIKYTPEGGTVAVHLGRAENELVLSVEDTGIGIAPEKIQLLFSRYQRVCADAGQIPGVGLGLLIVKEIVEAHQGRVELWSQASMGSRFSIHLPIPRADD